MLPSWTWSSTPVTVTVWATFQLAVLNVRLAVETVPSAGLLLATGIATLAVGWLLRRTVKLAVPPASVVTRPVVGVTVMPAASLSVFVTDTSAGLLLATGIATLAVGWLLRRPVKRAVPPASVVTRPVVGVTVMPAASLSVFVTDTSAGFVPE